MDGIRFDNLTRSLLVTCSRRWTLASLAGLLSVGAISTEAKKRKGKGKKRRKKKRRQVSSLPSPVSVHCDAVDETFAGNSRRWAETFLAPRSGRLTTAEIFLRSNPAGLALTFEIRTVDAAGVPTPSILASTTIAGIPKTPDSETRRIGAVFTTPAPVTAGARYALVVTATNDNYALRLSNGNPCPDGRLFFDPFANGTFVDTDAQDHDLVFAVLIEN